MDRWESVFQSETPLQALRTLFDALRRGYPVASIVLLESNPDTRTLKPQVSATLHGQSIDLAPIHFSDFRWSELLDWIVTGDILRQYGPRRSGKLLWVVPESIQGEVIAFPLRRPFNARRSSIGIVLFELEAGRALRDEQFEELKSWLGPLWLILQTTSDSTDRLQLPPQEEEGGEQQEELIGATRGLRTVMERVELVAPADMPVLILGDTGTGKEVVARAIHNRSSRKGRPFVRVNCGAIPTELIDSQLFGHERGSFTGASDQRKGWFERANGGTLFLDEIGELSLAAQVRLLRVLQEHQIERVGGQASIHVDVRIIAATHRDLATMVHKRTFREDLWYRINMFPVLLPTLAERTEDIPALAAHFAKRAAAKFGLHAVELSPADIKRLGDYRWPGNIRELQAVMDRAVILGRGTRLDIENALGIGMAQRLVPAFESDEPTFYEVIPEQTIPSMVSFGVEEPVRSANDPLCDLDEAIRAHIQQALMKSKGQIEGKRGAAQILNINPHTLRAKMRKLGIKWEIYRDP